MSDIALSGIFLFIIMVELHYSLLITVLSLAGEFILRIILAIVRVFGDIDLNSFTNGYEKWL